MAWLAMAIQIISPCEVFLVTKEGGGDLGLVGLVAYLI